MYSTHRPPIIIKNSPIQFIISGPEDGRDRILIRSESADISMIGMVLHAKELNRQPYFTSPIFHVFGGGKQVNRIEGGLVFDSRESNYYSHANVDARPSSLNFAWIGESSSRNTSSIRRSLVTLRADIYHAYLNQDTDDIEFQIATIIHDCALAQQQTKRKKLTMALGALLYIATGLIYLTQILVQKSTTIF